MKNNLNEKFYNQIVDVLHQAKTYAGRTVNFASVLANWHTGRLIVEEEQSGKKRARYGSFLIRELSKRLTRHFGKGYDITNLKLFRKFYLEFPVCEIRNSRNESINTNFADSEFLAMGDMPCNLSSDSKNTRFKYILRPELSWSHYRLLMRVEKPEARQYYIDEAVQQNWNVEQLRRQINSFYYERLKATNNSQAVKNEAKNKLEPLKSKSELKKIR